VESFNGERRDELLARESFDDLLEAEVLIERWRPAYNIVRPRDSLGYRLPAPAACGPAANGVLQVAVVSAARHRVGPPTWTGNTKTWLRSGLSLGTACQSRGIRS
jgi:hypothetical protein